MPYKRHHDMRMKLLEADYALLLDALEYNAGNHTGHFIASDAVKLIEKIERYGRKQADSDGRECYELRFFTGEGEMFIWQLIAMVSAMKKYEEANIDMVKEIQNIAERAGSSEISDK